MEDEAERTATVSLASAVLNGLGAILTGTAHSLSMLFLVYGVIGGAGMGVRRGVCPSLVAGIRHATGHYQRAVRRASPGLRVHQRSWIWFPRSANSRQGN